MLSFEEALQKGFTQDPEGVLGNLATAIQADPHKTSWHFDFTDGNNTYELWFEALLFDDQYYVALYKNQELLTEKVVIKPGYIKGGDIE